MEKQYQSRAVHWDHKALTMNPCRGESWGKYSLLLNLPGSSVYVTGISSVQRTLLEVTYSKFTAESIDNLTEDTIECKAYRLKDIPHITAKELTRDGQYSPRQIRESEDIHLTGINFEAWFGFSLRYPFASLGVAVELELADSGVIENFLRVYAAHRTLKQGGLVLHSAGLVFDDRAYIFSGRSNAGKTTLTRKAYQKGARVLSDDINLLLPATEGYQAHAVPFTGEFGRTLDQSGGLDAYPVAAVILLKQGERLATETVTTADAVATLLTGCPFVNTDAEESSALFDAVINLVAALPVIRLFSSRDDNVDDIMAAITKQLQSATG